MIYSEAIARLERGISLLPGTDAQAALAPRPRRQWPANFNPARIRQAAGLLLVFPSRSPDRAGTSAPATFEGDSAHIVLTVRSDSVRHGGQVSLPGGVVDPGETFEQAALREALEEIALDPRHVRTLGPLTPLDIPVSGFRLHPIAAACDARPSMHPSDGEVARILELDIDELMRPSAFRVTERMRDGRTLVVPGFHLAGVEIWGATAMVLAEFLALLGWSRSR